MGGEQLLTMSCVLLILILGCTQILDNDTSSLTGAAVSDSEDKIISNDDIVAEIEETVPETFEEPSQEKESVCVIGPPRIPENPNSYIEVGINVNCEDACDYCYVIIHGKNDLDCIDNIGCNCYDYNGLYCKLFI